MRFSGLVIVLAVAGCQAESQSDLELMESSASQSARDKTLQPCDLQFSEVMANPSEVSDANGEWVEIYNSTATSIDLNGMQFNDAGSSHTISSSVVVPAMGYATLCRNADPLVNGGVPCDYDWSSITLNNSSETISLIDSGTTITTYSYSSSVAAKSQSAVCITCAAGTGEITGLTELVSDPMYNTMDYGTPQAAAGVCGPVDSDADGLTDDEEDLLGTDPFNPDSDSDGLIDGEEVNTHGTEPLNSDTDADGLTDGEEVNLTATNPLNPDTDGDGLIDGEEVNTYDTDPLSPDTDLDGLLDGDEIMLNTNPNNPDTDGGGVTDGVEVNINSTDPLDPSDDIPAGPDADLDGFTVAMGDCDDSNSSIYPGAPELTDGMDNDCDGLIDESILTCDAYLVKGSQLFTFVENATHTFATPTPFGPTQPVPFNALAMEPNTELLMGADSTGSVHTIDPATGMVVGTITPTNALSQPLPGGNWVAGTADIFGFYYIQQPGAGSFFAISPAGIFTEVFYSQPAHAADFAYNQVDGQLYGFDHFVDDIVAINPVTGSVSYLGTTGPLPTTTVGSVWFSDDGMLHLYANKGDTFKVDLLTNMSMSSTPASKFYGSDGAECIPKPMTCPNAAVVVGNQLNHFDMVYGTLTPVGAPAMMDYNGLARNTDLNLNYAISSSNELIWVDSEGDIGILGTPMNGTSPLTGTYRSGSYESGLFTLIDASTHDSLTQIDLSDNTFTTISLSQMVKAGDIIGDGSGGFWAFDHMLGDMVHISDVGVVTPQAATGVLPLGATGGAWMDGSMVQLYASTGEVFAYDPSTNTSSSVGMYPALSNFDATACH